MYCSKCGAAVNGKFCSCCGQRVRSGVEEYRLAERRMRKDFVDSCRRSKLGSYNFDLLHLAESCWQASSARYDNTRILALGDHVSESAIETLEIVRNHAAQLFQALIDF